MQWFLYSRSWSVECATISTQRKIYVRSTRVAHFEFEICAGDLVAKCIMTTCKFVFRGAQIYVSRSRLISDLLQVFKLGQILGKLKLENLLAVGKRIRPWTSGLGIILCNPGTGEFEFSHLWGEILRYLELLAPRACILH